MTFISTLGQALDQVDRIKQTQLSLATLQNQIATGKKAQLFSGLGTDVLTSERARADLKQLDSFNQNITVADRRIKLMLNSLQEIKSQAENVVNAIQIQTQQGEYEQEAVSDLASKAADFIRNLINEQDGDRYLFGGAETQSRPLEDTGTLDTYLQTQLNDWVNSSIDTDQLIASYRDRGALNDGLVGYSAPLTSNSAKSVYVRVDDATEIDYTILGNNDGLRDIVVALQMIENIDVVLDEVTLDPEDDPLTTVTAPGAGKSEQNDNFFAFFNDLAKMINQAIDKLDNDMFSLSQDQAQISQIQESHKLEQNILKEVVADVEDIDLNEVAVQLNSLQIQLEASFRVTAALADLSLVNFI